MKKKVLRERRHKDSTAITAEKAIEMIDKAMDMLAEDLVKEIVEEAKPTKKRASKKKEA